MALSPKLEMRQSQSLVMTPQLQQAIKLLQLSNMELTAYVEAELERNPLLEKDERDQEAETERPEGDADEQPETPDADGGAETAADGGEDEWLDLAGPDANAEAAANYDTDQDNVFPDSEEPRPAQPTESDWSAPRSGGSLDPDSDYNLEAFVAEEIGLHDHLVDQLNLAIADPAQRLIGQHLIDMVDEAGYLRGDLESVAARLSAPPELVQEVLQTLQGFDPAGVFARDLKECLALQLKERDRYDPVMQAFVANIHLLGAHDIAGLRRACGADDEDLADMIDEVRTLNPKPGLKFGRTTVQPVVPDVFVRARPDGAWHVELNSDTLPKVLVNRAYYGTVSKTARGADDKSYLMDCLQTANWLVKSLDQRARTILKVSQEIVRQQDAFLTYGVQHLRPLNLKTVAEAISMHESTVSRVTSNKYMATPRGIFELKYFFTSAIASSDAGEAHSSESVRHRIKQLIDNEAPDKILSDDKIVALLRAEGIDIARRTVAKYRESMRISSSVQRRREKSHAARSRLAAEAVSPETL